MVSFIGKDKKNKTTLLLAGVAAVAIGSAAYLYRSDPKEVPLSHSENQSTYLQNPDNLSPEEYVTMFNLIRDQAEETPQILDHLGPNANLYLEKKYTDKYMGTIEDAVSDVASGLYKKCRSTLSLATDAKDYLVENFGDE